MLVCVCALLKTRTRIFYVAKKLTHCSKTQRLFFAELLMPLNEKFLLPVDYHQTNKIKKVLAISKFCENINWPKKDIFDF